MTPQQARHLVREAKWQVVRLEILERDDWTCQVCDRAAECVHHILGRKYPSLFLDERYLAAICWECNQSDVADTVTARQELLEKLANLRGYDYSDCPDHQYIS